MPTMLVTGANRGIGLEFARQYAADGWEVIGTVRNLDTAGELRALPGSIRIEQLELADGDDVAAFHRRLVGEPLDLFIANAGMSGPHGGAGDLDQEDWVRTLVVNSVAPTILADSLVPNVEAAGGKMVAISSQMGSIADNGSGRFVAYRSSKSALNSAWRSLAIDLRGRAITLAMFNPGWVRTDMGGPNASISPEASVTAMRRVIAGLTPERSGAFLNHDGADLPW